MLSVESRVKVIWPQSHKLPLEGRMLDSRNDLRLTRADDLEIHVES